MRIPRNAPCPCCFTPRKAVAGADLRKARERAHLTGRQFAKLAGISPTHACDIEHDRRRATPEIVKAYEALARKEGR